MSIPGLTAALQSRRQYVDDTSESVTATGRGGTDVSGRSGRTARFAGMSFINKSPTGYVGLVNQGATCYLNSLLQLLFMLPDCRSAVYRTCVAFADRHARPQRSIFAEWQHNPEIHGEERLSLPRQLQRLFAQLQLTERGALSTTALTKSFGWDSGEGQAFVQHDVGECMAVIMNNLEFVGSGTPLEHYVSRIQTGRLQNFIHCTSCGHNSRSVEPFTTPVVHIKGAPSLQMALAQNVTPEVLEGSNAYACSACDQKVRAYKGWHFLGDEEASDGGSLQGGKLPIVLPLHLSRYEWDLNTMRRVKVVDSVPFPLVLDVQLACQQHISGDMPGDTLPAVGMPEPPAQWTPYCYELVGVMMHMGGAHGGHYFAYIKDYASGLVYDEAHGAEHATKAAFARACSRNPTADTDTATAGVQPADPSELEVKQYRYRWLKFNDSHVSELTTDSLRRALGLRHTSENTAGDEAAEAEQSASSRGAAAASTDATVGAYMLFYRRLPRPSTHAALACETDAPAPPVISVQDVPEDLAAEFRADNETYAELKAEYEWEQSMRQMRVHCDLSSIAASDGTSESQLLQAAGDGNADAARTVPSHQVRLHESRSLRALTLRAAAASGLSVMQIQGAAPPQWRLCRIEPAAAPSTAHDYEQDDCGSTAEQSSSWTPSGWTPEQAEALLQLARVRRYDPVKDLALDPLAGPTEDTTLTLLQAEVQPHKPLLLETREHTGQPWAEWLPGGMPLRVGPCSLQQQALPPSEQSLQYMTVCVAPQPDAAGASAKTGKAVVTVADLHRCVESSIVQQLPNGQDWSRRCRCIVLRGEDVLVLGELAPPQGVAAGDGLAAAAFHIPLQAPLSASGVPAGSSRGAIARRVALLPGDSVIVEQLPEAWAGTVSLHPLAQEGDDEDGASAAVGQALSAETAHVQVLQGDLAEQDIRNLMCEKVPSGQYLVSAVPQSIPSPSVSAHEGVVNTVQLTFNTPPAPGTDLPGDAQLHEISVDRRSSLADLRTILAQELSARLERPVGPQEFKVRAYRGAHKPVAGSCITGGGQEWKDAGARLTYYGLMEGGQVVLEWGQPLKLGEVLWSVWLHDGSIAPPAAVAGKKPTLTKDPRFTKLGHVVLSSDTPVPAAKAVIAEAFAGRGGLPGASRMRLRDITKAGTIKLSQVYLDTRTLAQNVPKGLADGKVLIVQEAPEDGEVFGESDTLLSVRQWCPLTAELKPAVEFVVNDLTTFDAFSRRIASAAVSADLVEQVASNMQFAKPFSYHLSQPRGSLPGQKYWDATRLAGDAGIGKGSQPLPSRTLVGKPWRLKQGDVLVWCDQREDAAAACAKMLQPWALHMQDSEHQEEPVVDEESGKVFGPQSLAVLQGHFQAAADELGLASVEPLAWVDATPSTAAETALRYVAWPPEMGEHAVSDRHTQSSGSAAVRKYVSPETAFKIYTPQEIKEREEAKAAQQAAEAAQRKEALEAMQAAIAAKGSRSAAQPPAVPSAAGEDGEVTPLESIDAADAAAFADPVFGPYLRLIRMGMPMHQIIMKLRSDKVLGDMEADSETLESLLLERLPGAS